MSHDVSHNLITLEFEVGNQFWSYDYALDLENLIIMI